MHSFIHFNVNEQIQFNFFIFNSFSFFLACSQVNNALVKFDMEERTCQVWHEGGGIVGEPLFIPAPPPPPDASNSGDEDEDDGVVISVVTQGDGLPALLVLDGKTHKEVARAVLPYGIVNGFHGAFIPS